MIIGREKEIQKLNGLYESRTSELVALYGRRRVGKTFLVDEVFAGRITFRHSGLFPVDDRYNDETIRKSRLQDQLRHFARSLAIHEMGNLRKPPKSWMDAFFQLEIALQNRDDGKTRQLVFLDEIQWLDTPKSGFITALEAFWNGWACHRSNLMVIVCGSSTSWILDKLIHNHGGLYGRVTCQIRPQPFSLYECEKFFAARGNVFSKYDIVQAWMMVGGIPYYLKYFEKELSLAQNIDALFFSREAPLRNEFDELFSSLFVNPDVMKSIIIAVNSRKSGLTRSEILQKTGIADSGEFSKQLKALISGHFIDEYIPYGKGNRDARFRLTDPFCIFHLRFIAAKGGRHLSWVNLEDSGPVSVWRGLAFENVCFSHTEQIKDALGISGVTTSESIWYQQGKEDSPGAQIDMIIDRRDHIINLCEIKFYRDLYSMDQEDHFALVRRRDALQSMIPKRSAIHNTLITTYGLVRNEYAGDYLRVITLEDLFAF